MKNTFKVKAIQRIAGIIAIVAIIGFSMAACGGDDDSGGGGSGGTFTLTGIPSKYNGMYFKIDSLDSVKIDGSTYYPQSSVSKPANRDNYTWARISNGRVSVPMWAWNGGTKNDRWTGGGNLRCTISISKSESYGMIGNYGAAQVAVVVVSFSNGGATKSWNDFKWTEY